jgi:hypothetical protein
MPLNYSQAFIDDYTVGFTIVLLQTVLSLTVLTIALSVDSRVPRRFPYCTVLLALSTVDSLEAGCRLQTLLLHRLLPPRSNSLFHTRLSLKWTDADGRGDTMSHRSSMRCDGLITEETSVVYFTRVAVGPF